MPACRRSSLRNLSLGFGEGTGGHNLLTATSLPPPCRSAPLQRCYICGNGPDVAGGKLSHGADNVDGEVGYVLGKRKVVKGANGSATMTVFGGVAPCCARCNTSKSDQPAQALIVRCRAVIIHTFRHGTPEEMVALWKTLGPADQAGFLALLERLQA